MKLRRSIHVPTCARRRAKFILVIAVFCCALLAASPALARPLVVIDPGHGGAYNHARYGTLLEKQANLLLALELGRQLYAAGYDVNFTRTTDTAVTYSDIRTWHWVSETGRWVYAEDGIVWYADGTPRDDLQARCDVANGLGADIFISMHCNGAASSAAAGTENWASSHDVLGQQLGQYVQAAVLEQTHQRNRGSGVTDFYVVRWTNMPALLLESGFMSNPYEGAAIANAAWRQSYVRGVVNGINRWMATDPLRATHTRFTGASRSEGAVVASRTQFPSGAETVLLALTSDTASGFAAPTASARLGAPLLYADIRGLSDATKAELARLHPARIIAFGVELPDVLLEQAAVAAGLDPSAVERIAGSEPLATAPLLSEELASAESSITVVLASGASMTDALTGAALAGRGNSALLLTRADGSLPPEALDFLETHRANIASALVVGAASDSGVSWIANRTRVGSADPNQTFSLAAEAAHPTGQLWLFCYNPLVPEDALLAHAAAATRPDGVAVPLYGRYLPPYAREWLENFGNNVFGITMVGDYTSLPGITDRYVLKAIAP